jgi:hypothetical protein
VQGKTATTMMSVGDGLTSAEHWRALLAGDVDAIRLAGHAVADECSALADFVVNHPRLRGYSTAGGVGRLGASFSDARKSASMAAEYSTVDILVEAFGVNGAIPRLAGRIASSWPFGVETLVYDGVALHRSIARVIAGGGAEPHDDNIAKEVPHSELAASVLVQVGVNLYVEMPAQGGELEGWRTTLNREEYDRLRNTERGREYGIRREAIGEPDWQLRPATGDVILFRNSELHAIRGSQGRRITWGFFLGYRGPSKPLLMWS